MKNPKFNNGDLSTDFEKIKDYDVFDIRKDSMMNEGEKMFTIEANDNSYFYHNEKDRDKDYRTLVFTLALQ